MNNTELSLQAITERLARLEGPKYKKMEGSSYGGVRYELYDELCNRSYSVDIRLVEKHNALVFEMYPGIHVASQEYIPSVALYCQEIKTSLGTVNVDRTHRDVKFHAETSYEENPVTEITIEVLERVGIEVLRKHYENLSKLASGRVLDLEKVEEIGEICEEIQECELEANIENIRDFLKHRSHHNAICESLSESGETKFCCNILTEEDSFMLDITFKRNGFMVLRGNYGENAMVVAKPYRYGVADYLNEQNAKHMYSTLYIGDDSQGVYGEISTSLLDGIIGDDTIEFLEHILLKTLRDSAYPIQKLSAGIMPREQESEEDEMKEMLKKALADRLGNTSGIGGMSGLSTPSSSPLSNLFHVPSFLRHDGDTDFMADDMDALLESMDEEEVDAFCEETEDEISMDDYLKDLDSEDTEEGEDE